MSNFTTMVRYVCETYSGYEESQGLSEIDNVLKGSWEKIFGEFTLYNDEYKETLCCKILRHYYMREICCESVGLWVHYMRTKLNEILPYYNKLYESAQLEFNPLHNIEITRLSETDVTGETTNTQSAENETKNLFSDTPQGAITNLENGEYLTTATIQNGKADAVNKGDYINNQKGNETVTGKDGSKSFAEMVREYRDIIINIDLQIINEFKDCFMQIWE